MEMTPPLTTGALARTWEPLLDFDFVINTIDEPDTCLIRIFDRMLRKTFAMNRRTTRFTF